MYKKLDIFFGLCVITIFLWFLWILFSTFSIGQAINSYTVKMIFSSADGILEGSDIKIAGVRVGEVDGVSVNHETFVAEVTGKIHSKYKLPIDSFASVQSSGLLGEKYIEFTPGFEEEVLKDDSIVKNTQSSLNLEKLISQFASGGSKN